MCLKHTSGNFILFLQFSSLCTSSAPEVRLSLAIQEAGWARQAIHCPTLYIVVGSICHWSWIALMFSSSWSMPLFTGLLGMLVISLFWKKEAFSWGASFWSSMLHASLLPQSMLPTAAALPALSFLFTISLLYATAYTFMQAEDVAVRQNSVWGGASYPLTKKIWHLSLRFTNQW